MLATPTYVSADVSKAHLDVAFAASAARRDAACRRPAAALRSGAPPASARRHAGHGKAAPSTPDDPDSAASVQDHLAFLAGQIKQIDHGIGQQIQNDPELARRAELLRTIPGFGAITAATSIAELPELGRIGTKQIAALLGVAPLNQDSGQMRGQAHIAGGRQSARCIL